MNMNVLELRGSLVSIIADVKSEQVLRQILSQSLSILRAYEPDYDFSPELLAELDGAYAESDDAVQAISAHLETGILGFEADGTPVTEENFMLSAEEARDDLKNGQLLTQKEAKALFQIYE